MVSNRKGSLSSVYVSLPRERDKTPLISTLALLRATLHESIQRTLGVGCGSVGQVN